MERPARVFFHGMRKNDLLTWNRKPPLCTSTLSAPFLALLFLHIALREDFLRSRAEGCDWKREFGSPLSLIPLHSPHNHPGEQSTLFFQPAKAFDWQGAHGREEEELLGHTTVLCLWSSSWGVLDRGWIHPVDYLTFHLFTPTWNNWKKKVAHQNFLIKWRHYWGNQKVGPYYSEVVKGIHQYQERKTFPRCFSFKLLSTLNGLLFSETHFVKQIFILY